MLDSACLLESDPLAVSTNQIYLLTQRFIYLSFLLPIQTRIRWNLYWHSWDCKYCGLQLATSSTRCLGICLVAESMTTLCPAYFDFCFFALFPSVLLKFRPPLRTNFFLLTRLFRWGDLKSFWLWWPTICISCLHCTKRHSRRRCLRWNHKRLKLCWF